MAMPSTKEKKRLKNGEPASVALDKHPNKISVLQQQVHEKEVLLSITNSLASITNKRDILHIIHPKLKEFFFTEDVFICRSDEGANVITPFLRVGKASRQQHTGYAEVLDAAFPASDEFFQTILHSGKPVLSSLAKLCKPDNAPPYLVKVLDAGLHEGLSVTLYNGKFPVGILTFWAEKEKGFTKHHQELIKKVADQLSIAVVSIIDRERIEQKEKENNILLAVSHAIASIRNKNDLIHAIQKTLRSTLCFTDLAITKFNLAKGTFKVFLESCETTNQHPDFEAVAFSEYPVADGIHDLIRDSANTVVLKVDQLVKEGMVHIQFLQQAGIKELAGIRLKHNDTIIGTMVLLSTAENAFPPQDQFIIQEVSHHFATAMVNIIYYEEIQERSKEKEILLSISRAFSTIRRKEDLRPILMEQLQALGFYSDISIVRVDPGRETFSSFLVNENAVRATRKDYPQMRAAHHRFPDGFFEVALRSQEPVVFNIEKFIKREAVPSYVKFMYDNGTIDIIGISLRDRSTEIGVLFLFSDKRLNFSHRQLSLVQGIGDQLGAVVANLLANEVIEKREQEKSRLLSFSKETALVRNKEELFNLVKSSVTDLFEAEGFAIGLIADDRKNYQTYLFDVDKRIKSKPGFAGIVSEPHPLNDGIFDVILQANHPVFFWIDKLPDQAENPVINFWKQCQLELIIGVALKVSNVTIGSLFLQVNKETGEDFQDKSNLFTSVCSQISIALSNIIANDKIAAQLTEISRYKEQLEEEKQYLREEISSGFAHNDLIGKSEKMQEVFQLVSQVSFANSTVLITGETGTGKELIARAIHNASPRKEALLVKVNCAALPANLVESELFGHERGSFTGATDKRIGKFELANNGTLFLDEIGELPLELQVKLLRAIQEKEIERIGGKSPVKIDVRILAATNRDLQLEVNNGNFRRDLFYRLNVFPIPLPPLRERKEDIPLLVYHLIEKYNRATGRKISNISGKAMKQLLAYDWPGNVRELEHLLERSMLLSDGQTIKNIHLPVNNKKDLKELLQDSYLKTSEENERDHILQVLQHCQGRIYGAGGAAEILKLKVSTLNSRMKKLGIKKTTTIG